MTMNPIIARVTFIQQLKTNSVIGSATGFFYARNDKLFLTTNRHVVNNELSAINPDTLRLFLHRTPNDLSRNGTFDIPLYSSSGIPLWKELNYQISDIEKKADVILIEIDVGAIQTQFYVESWSASNFLPSKYVFDLAEDVFIVGYPMGFFDQQHNLPVLRNAMVASVYGIPFNGHPYFLTDANLHPGTSGSPVITKPKNTWATSDGKISLVAGNPSYIVGIHSGTHSVSLSDGSNAPLGLGVAWYMESVEKIASLF